MLVVPDSFRIRASPHPTLERSDAKLHARTISQRLSRAEQAQCLPAGRGVIVARLHSTARDVDAYRGDGRRYIVESDELRSPGKPTESSELE